MSRAARIEAIVSGKAPDREVVEAVLAPDAARLGEEGLARARTELSAQVLGLGPLEAPASDPEVTDILVNGDGSVWVDRGRGLQQIPVDLGGPGGSGQVRQLAVRLAALAGRRLDENQPWVDGLLPGGQRLHAVLPPLVEGDAHLSLRIPRVMAEGLDGLSRRGMCGPTMVALLREVVRARCSYLVTGGTGSGKTTLLTAMLAEVPPRERIVVVEDVREMAVPHPHVVRLQGRGANVEGVGAVTLVDLVRQALRMRPDRLVVGEVRGPEVRELLAALNTGHDGGCGTLHANSPADVPARIEALGALAGLPRDAVHAQLASAVQVVIHVERRGDGRRLQSVSVVRAGAAGVTCEPALYAAGERASGWPALADLLGSPP